MSEQRETARRDAQKSGCARCADEKKITLVIEGEWYQNLKRVADTMNTVSWCNDDNTAESVFEEFVFPWMLDFLQSPKRLAESILEGIATGEDGECLPEPQHSARIEELRTAFKPLTDV